MNSSKSGQTDDHNNNFVPKRKSPRIALALGLGAGFFAFHGMGHIYLGKVSRGLGLLLVGWILYPTMLFFGILLLYVAFPFVFLVIIAFWFYQSADAFNKAKYYNDYVATNGKNPW